MSEEKGLAPPGHTQGPAEAGPGQTCQGRASLPSQQATGPPGLLCSYRPQKLARPSKHRELPMASDGSGSKLCNAKDEEFFFSFSLKGMS